MDERKRILKLVENGTITAEEGIELLEALAKQKSALASEGDSSVKPNEETVEIPKVVEPEVTKSHSQETDKKARSNDMGDWFGSFNKQSSSGSHTEDEQKSKSTTGFEDIFGKAFNNKKVEDMMGTLRQDLTDFSGKMMTLMNTTLTKMNLGEVESPFGEKVEFRKSYAFRSDEVRGFQIDVPNGQVTFEPTDEFQVTVDVHVKTPKKSDGTDTEARFLEDFIELKDGKLEIGTHSKVSQVELAVKLPKKQYDVVLVKMLTGNSTLNNVEAKLVKVKTSNGSIKLERGGFEHADLHTLNGTVEVRFVKGDDLEVETGNGRIYIDGELKEVEAESLNGNVAVTTTSDAAYKLKASAVAGMVELYVPKTVSIDGRAFSNFGKVDVGLADVEMRSSDEQLLSKSKHFTKILEGVPVLKLSGEARTGNVIVRYTGLTDL